MSLDEQLAAKRPVLDALQASGHAFVVLMWDPNAGPNPHIVIDHNLARPEDLVRLLMGMAGLVEKRLEDDLRERHAL